MQFQTHRRASDGSLGKMRSQELALDNRELPVPFCPNFAGRCRSNARCVMAFAAVESSLRLHDIMELPIPVQYRPVVPTLQPLRIADPAGRRTVSVLRPIRMSSCVQALARLCQALIAAIRY